MADQDFKLVWGAPKIGATINKTESAVYHLYSRGLLPVRKVGGQLVGKEHELRNPACWPTGKDGEAA